MIQLNYENDLNKALKRLRAIELVLNESSIVVFTDKRGNIQFVNDKFCKISKYTKEELIGQNQRIVNSGYHSKRFFKNLWKTIKMGNIWRGEIRNQAKDGTYYWVDTTILPFLDSQGEPYQYVAIRHDITRLKEQEKLIREKAYYNDPLTSLKNRQWLDKWIQKQTDNTRDNYTVLFLDVDYFKSINDTFGHYVGDAILKEIAHRIQNCLHPADFIVRHGGDEFIIILNNTGGKKERIMKIVNKVKERFSTPFYTNGKELFITISIGIGMNIVTPGKDSHKEVLEATIKQADTAMSHAKKQPGNTHSFNTSAQNQEMERYYMLVAELKQAMKNNEFHIVYQPIVNMNTSKIEGVEALLRWHNPVIGNVSPVEFIPLLEELGLIVSVGNWVLQSVCMQMKEWHAKSIHIERASVNVSPLQFADKQFVNDVKGYINEAQLDPKFIELEITESMLMNITKAEKTLTQLRNFGVTISIDDFGTGYSSLSYLKQLPINTLKIDKSFIDNLDEDDDVIVNTIITMGTNLNFKVLAEGVESKEQISYLQKQDCHEGQGYFWSKPTTAKEIEKIITDQLQSV